MTYISLPAPRTQNTIPDFWKRLLTAAQLHWSKAKQGRALRAELSQLSARHLHDIGFTGDDLSTYSAHELGRIAEARRGNW